MNIRSCELQTHLYAIAPHYCTKDKDQSGKRKPLHIHKIFIIIFLIEYTRECGYDEPLFDTILNRHTECDTIGRCPMNSYCNTQTSRCCIKGKSSDKESCFD
jgi:hypothetical protein